MLISTVEAQLVKVLISVFSKKTEFLDSAGDRCCSSLRTKHINSSVLKYAILFSEMLMLLVVKLGYTLGTLCSDCARQRPSGRTRVFERSSRLNLSL